jgi:hypothetical protein
MCGIVGIIYCILYIYIESNRYGLYIMKKIHGYPRIPQVGEGTTQNLTMKQS